MLKETQVQNTGPKGDKKLAPGLQLRLTPVLPALVVSMPDEAWILIGLSHKSLESDMGKMLRDQAVIIKTH